MRRSCRNDQLLRRHFTPSMIIALVALFVSLSGGAYAALVVTGKAVKNNSLTGVDIKDRSLTAKEFKRGGLPTGAAGRDGANGRDGAQGATGPGCDLRAAERRLRSASTCRDTTLTPGDADRAVAAVGPFTIRVSCADNSEHASGYADWSTMMRTYVTASGLGSFEFGWDEAYLRTPTEPLPYVRDYEDRSGEAWAPPPARCCAWLRAAVRTMRGAPSRERRRTSGARAAARTGLRAPS